MLSDGAAACKDQAILSYRRVEDAMIGLEWRLCRCPGDGILRRDNYYLYKQVGFKALKIPTIRVLYTFTDTQVTHSFSRLQFVLVHRPHQSFSRLAFLPARRSGFVSLCSFSFVLRSAFETVTSFRMTALKCSNG